MGTCFVFRVAASHTVPAIEIDHPRIKNMQFHAFYSDFRSDKSWEGVYCIGEGGEEGGGKGSGECNEERGGGVGGGEGEEALN